MNTPVESSTATAVMWKWHCPDCDLVTHIGMTAKDGLTVMGTTCAHFIVAREERGTMKVEWARQE
jgi:hypothetical protein